MVGLTTTLAARVAELEREKAAALGLVDGHAATIRALEARIAEMEREGDAVRALRARYDLLHADALARQRGVYLDGSPRRETVPADPFSDAWPIGTRVTKTKGSSWHGTVCGHYVTTITPRGYAVESEREPGSVQIYPEAALARTEEGR